MAHLNCISSRKDLAVWSKRAKHGDAVCTAYYGDREHPAYEEGIMWVRVDDEWVQTFNTGSNYGAEMFADDRRGVELTAGGGI